MRLAYFALPLAAIAAAAPSPEAGLRIVTRETFPAGFIEIAEYVQSERTRMEWRVPSVAPDPSGKPVAAGVPTLRSARIVRCDRQQVIFLNYEDTSSWTDPISKNATATLRLVSFLTVQRDPQPKSPNLMIETTTVQTGERKDAFGYAARRVITTERRIPLDAGGGERSEIRTDGWYIDLKTRPSCERKQLASGRAVLLGGVSSTANAARPPVFPTVTFRDVGEPERGYPIDVTTTSARTPAAADGPSSKDMLVTRKVVTQLSTEALDPELFQIPAGFRPATGSFSAFIDDLGLAWNRIDALVASLFR